MPHEKNDGGQAFPQLNSTGMTLRDWFAGQALAGNLERMEPMIDAIDPQSFAFMAYEVADAMIEARKG